MYVYGIRSAGSGGAGRGSILPVLYAFETSVNLYQSTRRKIPEDVNLEWVCVTKSDI